jgi:hypothetical protein
MVGQLEATGEKLQDQGYISRHQVGVTRYHMAGRQAGWPTFTELLTCTLECGLYFISDQIISYFSSPEHEPLFDGGHTSNKRHELHDLLH